MYVWLTEQKRNEVWGKDVTSISILYMYKCFMDRIKNIATFDLILLLLLYIMALLPPPPGNRST